MPDRKTTEQRRRDADVAALSGFTGLGALSAAAAAGPANPAPAGMIVLEAIRSGLIR